MNASPLGIGELFESLGRIGTSLLGLMQNRLELFSVEWQEEKLRLLDLLVWFSIAVAVGAAGIFVVIIALAFLLWEMAGAIGMAVLGVFALAVASIIIWKIRQKIRTALPPFSQTGAEFRKDTICLRSED